MSTAPPETVAALLAALPPEDEARLAPARREIAARPRAYPLGSGQAEEIALAAGLRPAIRQLLTATEAAAARARFERVGLVCVTADRPLGATRGGVTVPPASPSTERLPLFVGRERAHLEAACAAEMAQDEGHVTLGRLLGYPRCCVEAFDAAATPRRSATVLSRSLAATHGPLDPLLNVLDLDVFHFVSWYPCAFDCAHTRRYATAVASLLSRRHAAFVEESQRVLSAHRLVLTDGVQLSLRGALEGDTVHVTEAWPTTRDRHPRAAVEDAETEAIARALLRLRRASTLTVRNGAWLLDGRPEPGPVEAALYPFGGTTDAVRPRGATPR